MWLCHNNSKRNKILRVQYKKIRKKIHTECNSERCNPDINYWKRLPNYGFSICRSFSFLTTIQGKITLILSAYFQFQFISCDNGWEGITSVDERTLLMRTNFCQCKQTYISTILIYQTTTHFLCLLSIVKNRILIIIEVVEMRKMDRYVTLRFYPKFTVLMYRYITKHHQVNSVKYIVNNIRGLSQNYE